MQVDIAQVIHTSYERDPGSVRQPDDQGYTPLYLAAGFEHLPAVLALLALPPESGILDDLRSRDNADGLTPLETCEREIRSTREFTETLLKDWDGYPDDSLRLVWNLKRAAGEDVGSEDEFIARRKWGCTCNQCTGGWLSPRMRYRLEGE